MPKFSQISERELLEVLVLPDVFPKRARTPIL